MPLSMQEILDLPTREEVFQLLRSDITREYRIDIESDSTIRADVAYKQEQMAAFAQGFAQLGGILLPAVQEGFLPREAAVIFADAYASNFKLGKQVEDMFARLVEDAQKADKAPQKPKPEEMKAQGEAMKLRMEMQGKQIDMQMKEREHQMKLEEMQADYAMKRAELDLKAQELQLKQQQAQVDAALKQQQAQTDAMLHQRQAETDLATQGMQAELSTREMATKHQLDMQTMQAKAAAAEHQARLKQQQKPSGGKRK